MASDTFSDTQDQTARIVRLAKENGLGSIDLEAAAQAVLRSGAIDQAVDSVVVDRLFSYVGRQGVKVQSPEDAWTAWISKVRPDFDRCDAPTRNRLRNEFLRQQAQTSVPDERAVFESQMLVKYGPDWKSKMTTDDKVAYGGFFTNPNNRMTVQSAPRRELDSLLARYDSLSPLLQIEADKRIRNLRFQLGEKV